jgi:hypothetical protein
LLLISHTITLKSAPEAVWRKLIDWKQWPTWDAGQESIQFDGPIDEYSIGKLKLKGGPKVLLRVVKFLPGRSYVSEFDLVGSTFVFDHFLDVIDPEVTNLTFTVATKGFLSLLWGLLLKGSLKKKVPVWMENFRSGLAQTPDVRAKA